MASGEPKLHTPEFRIYAFMGFGVLFFLITIIYIIQYLIGIKEIDAKSKQYASAWVWLDAVINAVMVLVLWFMLRYSLFQYSNE